MQHRASDHRHSWASPLDLVHVRARRREGQVTVSGTHAVTVGWVVNNHGYPYRATCECGWQSNTYAVDHAAQGMADAHMEKVA